MRLRTISGRGSATLLVAAALAAAGCGGSGSSTAEPPVATTTTTSTTTGETLAASVAAVHRQLDGIPQHGLTLGRATAPVTIIEYAGFDCPACTTVHEGVLPAVIERYVRPGKASLELRLLSAGDHDLLLALGAHAARPQSRAWDMAQLQYLRAASGGSGPLAATETPTTYARALGLDVPRWKRDLERPKWAADLRAALDVFKVAKWGATPVFLIRRIGLDVPFEVVSAPTGAEEFDAAISAALGR